MNYSILIIEESSHTRHRYAQALLGAIPSGARYEIITVSSTAAAILQASRQHFDLVIAPLRENNDGIQLVQDLIDIATQRTFLLLADESASSFQIQLAEVLGARVIEYPVTEAQLPRLVAEQLGLPVPALSEADPPLQPAAPPARSTTEFVVGRPALAMSAAHMATLRATLAELGKQAGVRIALLADLSGQDIASWHRIDTVDMAGVAALAAGDLLATIEINQLLGGRRSCNLIVQEHDEQTIVMARVGTTMILVLATEREIPLGWVRLAIKRAADQLLTTIEAAAAEAVANPAPALSEDFEAQFAAQIAGW